MITVLKYIFTCALCGNISLVVLVFDLSMQYLANLLPDFITASLFLEA